MLCPGSKAPWAACVVCLGPPALPVAVGGVGTQFMSRRIRIQEVAAGQIFWRHRRRWDSKVARGLVSHVSANRALRTADMLSRDTRWNHMVVHHFTAVVEVDGTPLQ
eukprot:gene19510-biopygen6993